MTQRRNTAPGQRKKALAGPRTREQVTWAMTLRPGLGFALVATALGRG